MPKRFQIPMKKYDGLNPFLQSVNSPINDKGFVPVTQNYPVEGDSINPAPSITFGPPPSDNFFIPPSPVQFGFGVPSGAINFINLSQGAVAEINQSANVYIHHGISAGTAGTTNITSGTQTINSFSLGFGGTAYTYMVIANFKALYNGFGAEGTVGTVTFNPDLPTAAAVTDQVVFAGHWAGTSIVDFETVTIASASETPATGTTAFSFTFNKPAGGAGTIIVKDIRLVAYYALLETGASV